MSPTVYRACSSKATAATPCNKSSASLANWTPTANIPKISGADNFINLFVDGVTIYFQRSFHGAFMPWDLSWHIHVTPSKKFQWSFHAISGWCYNYIYSWIFMATIFGRYHNWILHPAYTTCYEHDDFVSLILLSLQMLRRNLTPNYRKIPAIMGHQSCSTADNQRITDNNHQKLHQLTN